jgi:hypothetical protein
LSGQVRVVDQRRQSLPLLVLAQIELAAGTGSSSTTPTESDFYRGTLGQSLSEREAGVAGLAEADLVPKAAAIADP